MYELSLLERIQALEKKDDSGDETLAEIETRSVMTHLRKLLNTNRGSVRIDPEYGMPDMTVFSGDGLDETMVKMRDAIEDVVRRYEKRLSKVKVSIEPDKTDVLTIHFSLEAVLSRHENVPVFFHSLVNPSGRISVRK